MQILPPEINGPNLSDAEREGLLAAQQLVEEGIAEWVLDDAE